MGTRVFPFPLCRVDWAAEPACCPQCLLFAHSGNCWQSNDLRTNFDCALQACPVLQTYRVEPAGDKDSDDTLYEGVIKCPKNVLIYPKNVELPLEILPLLASPEYLLMRR